MQIWRGEGSDVLRELGDRLDELHQRTAAPLTSRRPWLQAWIDCYPAYRPVAVSVAASHADCEAVGLLGVRRVRGVDRVVACGHGPSDAVVLPATDDGSARLLAEALARDLRARSGWSLSLRHVMPEDLVLPQLHERLRLSRLVTGDVLPMLRADAGDMIRDHVSGKHRRGVSRIRNRMERDALEPQVEHVCDSRAVAALLPEVERVYRLRDVSLGRRCALDVPSHRDFFRRVVLDHAALDSVVLTTLHLQDRLAAFVLCFVDGDVLRMWNTRFDPSWDRYSPGKLAMEASVEHALATGRTGYDFMRGEERYKSSYANTSVVAQDFFASSGLVRSGATTATLAARSWMREAYERGGRPARFVETTRRLRDRLGPA
jgi:CelD/BcsL family acetyltransferase involved in cellulose biosynthesis